MKKSVVKYLLVLLLFCFFAPVNSNAEGKLKLNKDKEEFKYELAFSIGGYPFVQSLFYDESYFWSKIKGNYFRRGYGRYNELSAILSDYRGPVFSTGTLAVDFNLLLRSWFSLSFSLGYNYIWGDICDSFSNMKIARKGMHHVDLMPMLRFICVNTKYFQLYASTGFGLQFNMVTGVREKSSKSLLLPAFQINPLCFSVGSRKFYYFMEGGIGSMFFGAKMGVGFRF